MVVVAVGVWVVVVLVALGEGAVGMVSLAGA